MNLNSSVIPLKNSDERELTDFLLTHETTLLYTSVRYLKMLEFILGCEIVVIVVREKEQLVGYMPVAFKNNAIYGCVCNSLPFYGSNGGMVVNKQNNPDSIRSTMLREFYSLTKAKNCVACTIISNPLDAEEDAWLKANIKYSVLDERIGQITHFPDSKTENAALVLMNTFEDPRPRNIRKAQKEGVKVYAANTSHTMDFLYKTHYDNITAINGIPKEKSFFENIPRFFNNEEYKIYIAEHNGEKIAALLLFFHNRTVEYFTPAVVEKYRQLQPTALIIYQAMLDAMQQGHKNWNWGGTWLSQGGVYDFKKKWGTSDYRYFYYTQVIDDSLYHLSKETLLEHYPYFFVLPFNKLKT